MNAQNIELLGFRPTAANEAMKLTLRFGSTILLICFDVSVYLINMTSKNTFRRSISDTSSNLKNREPLFVTITKKLTPILAALAKSFHSVQQRLDDAYNYCFSIAMLILFGMVILPIRYTVEHLLDNSWFYVRLLPVLAAYLFYRLLVLIGLL